MKTTYSKKGGPVPRGYILFHYRGVEIATTRGNIKNLISFLREETEADRRLIIEDVNRYLTEQFDRFERTGDPYVSREVADKISHDLMIWFANEVFEGRARIVPDKSLH